MNIPTRSPLAHSLAALCLGAMTLLPGLAHASANRSSVPTGNGNFFPTTGTFQVVIRGENFSGVSTFSTSQFSTPTTPLTAPGMFSATANGESFRGNVDSTINSNSRAIAALLSASNNRSGAGLITQELSQQDLPVENTNGSVTYRTTTTGNTSYNDVASLNGSFSASLTNNYPVQGVKGKGSFTLTSLDFSGTLPTLVSETFAVSVSGVRTSDQSSLFIPRTVNQPFVRTTYTIQ